jgi:hypothetical protein
MATASEPDEMEALPYEHGAIQRKEGGESMTLCEFRVLQQADGRCSDGHTSVGDLLSLHEPDAG